MVAGQKTGGNHGRKANSVRWVQASFSSSTGPRRLRQQKTLAFIKKGTSCRLGARKRNTARKKATSKAMVTGCMSLVKNVPETFSTHSWKWSLREGWQIQKNRLINNKEQKPHTENRRHNYQKRKMENYQPPQLLLMTPTALLASGASPDLSLHPTPQRLPTQHPERASQDAR